MYLSDQTTFVSELKMDKFSLMMREGSSNSLRVTQSSLALRAFDIEKLIGRGSYAKVFLVTKKSTGEQYAMKVLKKSEMENK